MFCVGDSPGGKLIGGFLECLRRRLNLFGQEIGGLLSSGDGVLLQIELALFHSPVDLAGDYLICSGSFLLNTSRVHLTSIIKPIVEAFLHPLRSV